MRVVALLVAAGRGQRFGTTEPKQFLALAGRPVLRHAAEALLADGLVEAVLPVCSAGEEGRVSTLLDGLPILPPVQGGIARQDSVRAGLEALAANPPDVVLVHDAARPVLRPGTVRAVVEALERHHGAIPALPVSDTLKLCGEGVIAGTVPLVLSTGAGAEVRSVTGITVFAGMLGVTLFGLLLTPVFYVGLRKLSGAALVSHAPVPGSEVVHA